MTGNPNRANRELSILQLAHFYGAQGFYRDHLKRPLDIFICAAALIACAPVMLLAMLLIALETPGSPVFKQIRVGKDGAEFFIYKIRTMYNGADRYGFKTDQSDPRITKIGKFLRDTKIDELPQLLNIIRGDMSLIGPRPLSLDESKFVMNEVGINKQQPGFIPKVLPGCTGLEQIYRIHPLVYAERFHWNHCYEDNLSALLDLKILCSTILMCRFVFYAAIFGGMSELIWLAYLLIHSNSM